MTEKAHVHNPDSAHEIHHEFLLSPPVFVTLAICNECGHRFSEIIQMNRLLRMLENQGYRLYKEVDAGK